MNLFEVNIQTCNKDGICAAICPTGIIEMQKGEYPAPELRFHWGQPSTCDISSVWFWGPIGWGYGQSTENSI